jgi:hypothetical protein
MYCCCWRYCTNVTTTYNNAAARNATTAAAVAATAAAVAATAAAVAAAAAAVAATAAAVAATTAAFAATTAAVIRLLLPVLLPVLLRHSLSLNTNYCTIAHLNTSTAAATVDHTRLHVVAQLLAAHSR